MAKKLADFKEDLPLLVEAGLVAIKQGDEESARKLFQAVTILDPKNTTPKLGFGLIAMHKMQLDVAQKCFEEVLAIEPLNYRAQAFLGFCLILSTTQDKINNSQKVKNLEDGAKIATKVVQAKEAPETTKQLAQSLLDWEKELQEKATNARVK